jgi:phospho-acceptor domain-containing protein
LRDRIIKRGEKSSLLKREKLSNFWNRLSNLSDVIDGGTETAPRNIRKLDIPSFQRLGLQGAFQEVMASYDSTYKLAAPSPEQGDEGRLPAPAVQHFEFDPSRHIAPAVAHELNNILTVVMGFSDCLLHEHREDAALQPQLKRISEASRRAATIIREAMPKM